VRAQALARAPHRDDFGMRCRIVASIYFIVAFADDLTVQNNHAANLVSGKRALTAADLA